MYIESVWRGSAVTGLNFTTPANDIRSVSSSSLVIRTFSICSPGRLPAFTAWPTSLSWHAIRQPIFSRIHIQAERAPRTACGRSMPGKPRRQAPVIRSRFLAPLRARCRGLTIWPAAFDFWLHRAYIVSALSRSSGSANVRCFRPAAHDAFSEEIARDSSRVGIQRSRKVVARGGLNEGVARHGNGAALL